MKATCILVLCLVLTVAVYATDNFQKEESKNFLTSSRSLLQRRRPPSPTPSPPSEPTTREEPEDDDDDDEEEPEEEEPGDEEEPEDDDDEEEEELTEEERERAREEAALAAFAAMQERRANESQRIIARASTLAEDIVQRYRANATTEARVQIFQNLFQNAAGVAAKFALNSLVERGYRGGVFVRRNLHRGLYAAIQAGYAENVAEALENAFTIFQNPGDHYNLLDSIVERQRHMERREEGSGCEFIRNLFRDADAVAYDRGESMQFLAAFSADEYLPVTECFLDPCTGTAGACCSRNRALRRGLCGCPTWSSRRCDYNLFANRPRTVWVCSSSSCDRNQKCLCPAAPTS